MKTQSILKLEMTILPNSTPHIETPCLQHEEQIHEIARKTAELEAKNGFKAQRINELIEDNRRIESKIDKLTADINSVVVSSIQEDNGLKEEVTKLKTQIEAQDKYLEKLEKKQKQQRDDDRAKTNQYLTVIGIGLGVLYFVLNFVFK